MSSEKDHLLAGRKPSDLLPQPTPQELEFLDIVYEGSVDKLLAWLQLHQVRCNQNCDDDSQQNLFALVYKTYITLDRLRALFAI